MSGDPNDREAAQHCVSEADLSVERFCRERPEQAWPGDGIIGEEDAPKSGDTGFDWVNDPIDGTTNFINGFPARTVVLAGVADGRTRLTAIFDPSAGEMFAAIRGGGASLIGAPDDFAGLQGIADSAWLPQP